MVGRRIGEGDFAFVRLNPAFASLDHLWEVDVVDEGVRVGDLVDDPVEPAAYVHDRGAGMVLEIRVDLADCEQVAQSVDGGRKGAELLGGASFRLSDAHCVLRPWVGEQIGPAASGVGPAHQRKEKGLLHVVHVHGGPFARAAPTSQGRGPGVFQGSSAGQTCVGPAVIYHLGKANRTQRSRLGPFVSRNWGSLPSSAPAFVRGFRRGRVLKHSCRQGASEFRGLKSRTVDGTGLGPASLSVLRRYRRSVPVKPGSRFRLQSSIESKTNAGAVQVARVEKV